MRSRLVRTRPCLTMLPMRNCQSQKPGTVDGATVKGTPLCVVSDENIFASFWTSTVTSRTLGFISGFLAELPTRSVGTRCWKWQASTDHNINSAGAKGIKKRFPDLRRHGGAAKAYSGSMPRFTFEVQSGKFAGGRCANVILHDSNAAWDAATIVCADLLKGVATHLTPDEPEWCLTVLDAGGEAIYQFRLTAETVKPAISIT
jgi:hypothetical protein